MPRRDPHLFIKRGGPAPSFLRELESFCALHYSHSTTTSKLDIQYIIRKLIDAPSNPYPSVIMPPKKATGAKPAKTAAAAPHASYKGMLDSDFVSNHAVASLRLRVNLGRLPLLTHSTRHDQGSYPCCESTPPGAFDLAAPYRLRTTRSPELPTITCPITA